ncbi:hypothetical protein CEXT_458061 [Caerostris extrusa]|uniref:Uncharacterized protein n=1 Tax=Caerostris extrusa TaxID=172846 RepID=A0AAV4WT74_CAEEX|nr:hypothetical protein CEXT_458061 [Caerostris extrusa]
MTHQKTQSEFLLITFQVWTQATHNLTNVRPENKPSILISNKIVLAGREDGGREDGGREGGVGGEDPTENSTEREL